MHDTDGVQLLTISPIDIIDNLDNDYHDLSEEQKERILKLNDDTIYDAIYDATLFNPDKQVTKHFDRSGWYHATIEEAIVYLKNYVTSNEECV